MSSKRAGSFDLHIAQQIRSLRLKASMSQAELGEKLGISFQQIQKYEKGTNRVGAGRLFEIARIFGVPVHAFFPSSADFAKNWPRSSEEIELSNFMAGQEGRKLCENYLQLPRHQRRAISVLLRAMTGTDD